MFSETHIPTNSEAGRSQHGECLCILSALEAEQGAVKDTSYRPWLLLSVFSSLWLGLLLKMKDGQQGLPGKQNHFGSGHRGLLASLLCFGSDLHTNSSAENSPSRVASTRITSEVGAHTQQDWGAVSHAGLPTSHNHILDQYWTLMLGLEETPCQVGPRSPGML